MTLSGTNPHSEVLSPYLSFAPSNGKTWTQRDQSCLNQINNTPDGKFYNAFSYLSPLLGPDAGLTALGHDAAKDGAKEGAKAFINSTAKNMAGTALGSLGSGASDLFEIIDGVVLFPVQVAATGGQVVVHTGCAISTVP